MPDLPDQHPRYPIIADFLVRLNEVQRETFEERAGILEFDAGLNRAHAEALALLEVIQRHGWPSPAQI